MDVVFKQRANNHLKKLYLKGAKMSMHFSQMAAAHLSTAPVSEGEWEPPQSDLEVLGLRDLDSGEEADTEAADAKIQAASAQRACTKLSLSNANYKAAAASSNVQVKEITTLSSLTPGRASCV
jgi:hypothetical protein